MSLDKYRNKPCPCGSGKKFKHCCLAIHNAIQARVETPLAKALVAKEQGYWKRMYDRIKRKPNERTGI